MPKNPFPPLFPGTEIVHHVPIDTLKPLRGETPHGAFARRVVELASAQPQPTAHAAPAVLASSRGSLLIR